MNKEEKEKKLRAWRSRKASELNIGQFKLLTNAQLKEISTKSFTKVEELSDFINKDISEDLIYEIGDVIGIDVPKSKKAKSKKSVQKNKPTKKEERVKPESFKKSTKKQLSRNNI